jgi:hypothetical protein
MRRLIVILSILFLAGCAGHESVPYTEYSPLEVGVFPVGELVNLVIPESDSPRVNYKGFANYDKATISGLGIDKAEIGGVGVFFAVLPEFFAGVLLVNNMILNAQNKSMQQEADKVLMPFNEAIKNFHNSELLTQAIVNIERKNIVESNEGISNWVMESTPVFFIIESKNTMVLYNSIRFYSNKAKDKLLYTNLIKVLSLPLNIQDLELTTTSIDLFSHSIEFAISDIENKLVVPSAEQEQTISYNFAGKKRYERGILIAESCDRMFIRTLRGWIKSVPRVEPKSEPCNDMIIDKVDS